MKARIDKLTDKERSRVDKWIKKWIDIGLCTDEADWDNFERGVHKCYEFANLKKVPIIRVQSPIVGALEASKASMTRKQSRSAVGSPVRSAVGPAILSAVGSPVDSAVDSPVDSAVDSAVDPTVRSAIGLAILSAVDSAVDSAVRSAVRSAVGPAILSAILSAVGSPVDSAVDSAVRSAVRSAKLPWHCWLGGQFRVAWQAYVTFFTDVCKLQLQENIMERIKAYELAQKSACYWWPNKNFIIVCNRPSRICRNSKGELHNETGMSTQWRDGWGIYSLNGITVSKEIVETPAEKLNPELALKEKNADVQREIIRKIGADRILLKSNAKKLDIYKDNKTGLTYTLFHMRLNDNIDRKYLYFEHASMKGIFYAKPVPPEAEKSLHAFAWTRGLIEQLNNITFDKELEIIANLPKIIT